MYKAPAEPKAPKVPEPQASPARKFCVKASAQATSMLASALERHMTTPQVPGAKRES